MSKRDHGDGGIDERGLDRWRLRWRVDGKRFTKSFHGSIGEARKELRRLIKSADDGQHVPPDKMSLAAWIDRWLALQRRGEDTGGRGLVNARTLERYEELLRLHVIPTLGKRPLQRITATEIDTLYMALSARLAPRTVHHVHTVFGACLNAAVRKGLLVVSPTSRAEAPVPGESDAGQGLVGSAEIMEPQRGEAELAGAPHKLLAQAARVTRPGNVLAGRREDQRLVRQPD